MKVDVSNITKINGASLKIAFNGVVQGLDVVADEVAFTRPSAFEGVLENQGGTLKLEGMLNSVYTVKCYRCLKDLNRNMNLEIKEDFLSPKADNTDEAYTYQNNSIDLDRVLKDNIILNLPMKVLCSEECKGFCGDCGADLNVISCNCADMQKENPNMEALKNFFNNN